MAKHRNTDARKQKLPVDRAQKNALHGKTADDLPKTGELPVITLEKEIPATDLHEM
ncbi:MAG: hypothetical protein MJ065_09445 [Oscillospiraceae bacterium]|nr:hypothetical protein [Oscillospiraceae bacterium]